MNQINISVVYALLEHQEVINITCDENSTIHDAIIQSKICEKIPEIDLTVQEVGVFGLKQGMDFVLSDYDRVEIYRPLLVSPTEARRLRAKSRAQK